MNSNLICANCGSAKGFHTKLRGHFLITLILLLFYFIPGLIYAVWRRTGKAKVCNQCGSDQTMPINTPVGQKLFQEHHGKKE